jgi:hypothetical protein
MYHFYKNCVKINVHEYESLIIFLRYFIQFTKWIPTPQTSVADPDPGSGAFLTPGSGIRDEQSGSYFLELKNYFLG